MKPLEILSFGAGVQSTTLLLMSCRGELPKLDAAIFADTQAEPKSVYTHLEWCKEQAAAAGIPVHVRTVGNLKEDLLDFWAMRKSKDGKRKASIPAFVKNPDGSKGIVQRQCTSDYKIEVIQKFCRELLGLSRGQRWPLTLAVRQWIGISADEFHRRRTSMRPAIELVYPLIDQFHRADGLLTRGMSRADCLAWVADRGYPTPPRSACTFCPFHSDEEWVRLKNHEPEAFAEACEVDEMIRSNEHSRRPDGLVGKPYLHSSLIPLAMVEFKPQDDASEGRGMANDCAGMCGV